MKVIKFKTILLFYFFVGRMKKIYKCIFLLKYIFTDDNDNYDFFFSRQEFFFFPAEVLIVEEFDFEETGKFSLFSNLRKNNIFEQTL